MAQSDICSRVHCSTVYNSQAMKHGINQNVHQQINGSRGCEIDIYVCVCVYRDSLIAQLIKNLPAMQEAPVQFLGWEDLLEKEKATHSSVVA